MRTYGDLSKSKSRHSHICPGRHHIPSEVAMEKGVREILTSCQNRTPRLLVRTESAPALLRKQVQCGTRVIRFLPRRAWPQTDCSTNDNWILSLFSRNIFQHVCVSLVHPDRGRPARYRGKGTDWCPGLSLSSYSSGKVHFSLQRLTSYTAMGCSPAEARGATRPGNDVNAPLLSLCRKYSLGLFYFFPSNGYSVNYRNSPFSSRG